MSRILFVLSIPNYARELDPLVRRVLASPADVDVVVGWDGPAAAEYADELTAAGATVHRVPDPFRYPDPWAKAPGPSTDAPAPAPPPRASRVRRLRARLGLSAYSLSQVVVLTREFRAAGRWGAELVERVGPDVVVGSSYRSCGTFDQGIARAVRRAGIPYCCVPQSAYAGEENAVEARVHWHEQGMGDRLSVDNSRTARVLAAVFPGWMRVRRGVRVFAFEPQRMLPARLAGLLDENPWQQPSDLYDAVYVESGFAARLLRDSGYPERKVVVAGKPLADAVFTHLGDEAYERDLFAAIGLPVRTPFLLLNLEPAFEHDYATYEEHWERVHAVVQACVDAGRPVVLSLHPMLDPAAYAPLEQEYGVRIAPRRIVELYPYCGVSVSFPCSTNLFAALFERALVVYDFLGLTRPEASRSALYRLPGAEFAYSVGELRAALAREPAELPQAPRVQRREGLACDAIVADIRDRFGVSLDAG